MKVYDIPEGEGVPLTRLLARRHDGDWPVTGEWLGIGFPAVDTGNPHTSGVYVGPAKWEPGLGTDGELLIDHGPTFKTGGYATRTLYTRNEVRLFCAAFKIAMHPDMKPLWVPPEPKGG